MVLIIDFLALKSHIEALAAWSSVVISPCHHGVWSYGS
jgi:hypothetical protein